MAKDFSVSIISPEEKIYSGRAVSLIAPAYLGYLGVLANHAPMFTNTLTGKVHIKEASGKLIKLDIKREGFLEVLHNGITLLLR
ncbi:MAG: hypothetical protein NTW13_03960 [Candidatus Omnitrophica bacterium]|nr:hypothetical protein [Candidatus Omnitrophota bacterium]